MATVNNPIKWPTSSQQSIQKVVAFAAKHFPSCGEDIWDCVVEHMEKVLFYNCYHSPAVRFICFLFERVLLIPESTSSTSSTRFARHPLWLKPSRNLENHEKLTLMGYISFLFHGTSKKSSTWSSQKGDKVYQILSVLNRCVCGYSSSFFALLKTLSLDTGKLEK